MKTAEREEKKNRWEGLKEEKQERRGQPSQRWAVLLYTHMKEHEMCVYSNAASLSAG